MPSRKPRTKRKHIADFCDTRALLAKCKQHAGCNKKLNVKYDIGEIKQSFSEVNAKTNSPLKAFSAKILIKAGLNCRRQFSVAESHK